MITFLKLLALLRVAFPVPTLSDAAAVTKWITDMAPQLGDLIANLATQIASYGAARIELPAGDIVTLQCDENGCWCMSEEHQDLLASAASAELADGLLAAIDWKAVIKKVLPIILQLLPFFLADDKVVPPTPTPNPDPVV